MYSDRYVLCVVAGKKQSDIQISKSAYNSEFGVAFTFEQFLALQQHQTSLRQRRHSGGHLHRGRSTSTSSISSTGSSTVPSLEPACIRQTSRPQTAMFGLTPSTLAYLREDELVATLVAVVSADQTQSSAPEATFALAETPTESSEDKSMASIFSFGGKNKDEKKTKETGVESTTTDKERENANELKATYRTEMLGNKFDILKRHMAMQTTPLEEASRLISSIEDAPAGLTELTRSSLLTSPYSWLYSQNLSTLCGRLLEAGRWKAALALIDAVPHAALVASADLLTIRDFALITAAMDLQQEDPWRHLLLMTCKVTLVRCVLGTLTMWDMKAASELLDICCGMDLPDTTPLAAIVKKRRHEMNIYQTVIIIICLFIIIPNIYRALLILSRMLKGTLHN